VVRGGCWGYFGGGCRSADRYDGFPSVGGDFMGFRVVLAPGQP